jgi:Fe-S oxidoreductase
VIFFETMPVPRFFRFMMDLLLIFVLSGLVLAFLKRRKSKWFGMQKTTGYKLNDRIALFSLWLIFPLRLLAESYTAGYYASGGGFFTQPIGDFLEMINPVSSEFVLYLMWWCYSLVLGIFFFSLPKSRYMHIPSEILLIVFRHFGIQPKKTYSGFSDAEVHSCSRCGVCIDVCQLNTAGITNTQAVYFIRSIREKELSEKVTQTCMVCGRCQEVCPVGIRTDSLRLIKRRERYSDQLSDYRFLAENHTLLGDVVYFSGCMSHLTPAIISSMKSIFTEAGVAFVHLDAERSTCCGRPLMIAGKDRQANELIEFNRRLILQTGAKLLVTSCPICYRVFREEYNLPIKVLHHSQYLLDLVKTGRIPIQGEFRKIAYHDPCDLGRGTKTYEAPRELLKKIGDLTVVKEEAANGYCCGGSLGLIEATQEQRNMMTSEALQCLLSGNPDVIATACPLCKKTFARSSPVEVLDIAELLCKSVPKGLSYSSSGRSHPACSCANGSILALPQHIHHC